MSNYIFRQLMLSEMSIDAILNFLHKQKRINTKLTVVAVGTIIYIVRAEIRSAIQRSEIDTLQKEVEKLKSQKGE